MLAKRRGSSIGMLQTSRSAPNISKELTPSSERLITRTRTAVGELTPLPARRPFTGGDSIGACSRPGTSGSLHLDQWGFALSPSLRKQTWKPNLSSWRPGSQGSPKLEGLSRFTSFYTSDIWDGSDLSTDDGAATVSSRAGPESPSFMSSVVSSASLYSHYMQPPQPISPSSYKLAKPQDDSEEPIDNAAFYAGVDTLLTEISKTIQRQEKFEGTRGGTSPKKMANREEGDNEEKDAFQERLEHYKFHRRIEAEVAPLSKAPLLLLNPIEPVDNARMRYNCSQEAVQSNTMDAKACGIRLRRDKMISIRGKVLERHQNLLEERETYWDDINKQKQTRVAHLMNQRRTLLDRNFRDRTQTTEAWTKILVVIRMSKWFKEALDKHYERKAQASKNFLKLRKAAHIVGLLPHKRQSRDDRKGEEGGKSALQGAITAVAVSGRLLRKARAKQAQIMFKVLSGCKFAGRLFIAIRQFTQRIIFMQTWWRKCSKHLLQVRDRIAKRWWHLERSELASEIQVREAGWKKPGYDKGLSYEERAELVMMPDHVRNTFLEHELRARRFQLLPALRVWAEDVEKWKDDLKDLASVAQTAAFMTVKTSALVPVFKWPPIQPSYLPPSHPSTERAGGKRCCAEGCLGRKGDAQIFEMYRTCRQHPLNRGWQTIPPHGPALIGNQHVKRTTQHRQSVSQPTVVRPVFDDAQVDDEELKAHGVEARHFPWIEGPIHMSLSESDSD